MSSSKFNVTLTNYARGITLEEAAALGIVRPKTSLEPLIEATSSFIPAPGAAPLASLALNGLLALGAVWLGKKKHTAEKVSTSLVQGIDTFRDILDQTPQGARIDAKLKETLRQHQHALQVQKEISKLLATPPPPKSPSASRMPHKRNQCDGGAVEGGGGVEAGAVVRSCRSLRHPDTLYGTTASGLYRSEAAMGLIN